MKKILTSIAVLFAGTLVCSAQTSARTEFFLDNNNFLYRFNPAYQGETDFISLFFGTVDASAGSNIGVGNVLFSRNNEIVTGFNSAVSSADFIGRLQNSVNANVDIGYNFLSAGWWNKSNTSFFNIEVNVRGNVGLGVPRDLFALLKEGSSSRAYDFAGLRAGGNAFGEVAFGFSRKIGDKVTLGARAKLLVGVANACATFDKALVTINSGVISYDVDAKMQAAVNLLKIPTKQSAVDPTQNDVLDIRHFSLQKNFKPAGWGGALDLGVTYRPVDDLTLSLGVIDLGGIAWKYNTLGKSKGVEVFNGVTITDISDTGSVQDDLDKMMDNVRKLTEFHQEEGAASGFEMLEWTVNAGARYRMPFYNRLSVGLLGTYRVSKVSPWWDARAGLTVTPLDWLSFTGDIGYGLYGMNWGGGMSLNLGPFNLMVVLDSYAGNVSKIALGKFKLPAPVSAFNCNLKAGLTISFGSRHNDFKKF